MVINFICRASKADKSGLSPLEVSITINGSSRAKHRFFNSAFSDSNRAMYLSV